MNILKHTKVRNKIQRLYDALHESSNFYVRYEKTRNIDSAHTQIVPARYTASLLKVHLDNGDVRVFKYIPGVKLKIHFLPVTSLVHR